jgi:hypothetical protein
MVGIVQSGGSWPVPGQIGPPKLYAVAGKELFDIGP